MLLLRCLVVIGLSFVVFIWVAVVAQRFNCFVCLFVSVFGYDGYCCLVFVVCYD